MIAEPADREVAEPPGASSSGFGLLRQLWRPPHPFGPDEDLDAAPLSRPMAPGDRRFSWSRFRSGVAPFAMGLPFMAFFVVPTLIDPPPAPRLAASMAITGLVCLQYLVTPLVADLRLRWRWCYVVGFAVILIGGPAISAGWYAFALATYLTIMITMLIPWRQARIAHLVWLVIGLAASVIGENWVAIVMTVIAVGVGVGMGVGMDAGRVEQQLRRAERRIAMLAVASERERIARDLHDILGHSLTAITVKAGLAGRLIDHDHTGAKEQMSEVETIARQALSDVRATTSGLGQVRLTGEIAGARSVLMAAGVECELPSAVEPMPDEVSQLLGYVVREGVTNIVRHAHARRCVITVAPGQVTLTDDGVGMVRRSGGGSGLRGLTERAAAIGGVVTTTSGPDGGTVLSARVPAGGTRA